MEFRQTVQDSESGLERLMSHVPGYSGYKEKETRREADKLLREYLVGQLDVRRRRLAELQRQLLDGGGLLFMDDIERAVTKVQKLADMIRTATYGYAGLFDAVKVKESQLDALYSFDNQMLEQVTAIQTPIDALAAAIDSNGDVNAAIKKIIKATEDANARWRQREDVITGAA
jgi:hypothetical protein